MKDNEKRLIGKKTIVSLCAVTALCYLYLWIVKAYYAFDHSFCFRTAAAVLMIVYCTMLHGRKNSGYAFAAVCGALFISEWYPIRWFAPGIWDSSRVYSMFIGNVVLAILAVILLLGKRKKILYPIAFAFLAVNLVFSYYYNKWIYLGQVLLAALLVLLLLGKQKKILYPIVFIFLIIGYAFWFIMRIPFIWVQNYTTWMRYDLLTYTANILLYLAIMLFGLFNEVNAKIGSKTGTARHQAPVALKTAKELRALQTASDNGEMAEEAYRKRFGELLREK